MDIDSVGSCFHTKDWPARLDHLQFDNDGQTFRDRWGDYSAGTRALLETYKFRLLTISTIYDDYFAEKICQTLSAGVIPIYLGMPNGHLWDPGIAAGVHPAMIHVSDFESMVELASYVHSLSADTDDARRARHRYFDFIENVPDNETEWYPQHVANFYAKTGHESWEGFVCLKTWTGDAGHLSSVQAQPRGDWRTVLETMGKNASLWE